MTPDTSIHRGRCARACWALTSVTSCTGFTIRSSADAQVLVYISDRSQGADFGVGEPDAERGFELLYGRDRGLRFMGRDRPAHETVVCKNCTTVVQPQTRAGHCRESHLTVYVAATQFQERTGHCPSRVPVVQTPKRCLGQPISHPTQRRRHTHVSPIGPAPCSRTNQMRTRELLKQMVLDARRHLALPPIAASP